MRLLTRLSRPRKLITVACAAALIVGSPLAAVPSAAAETPTLVAATDEHTGEINEDPIPAPPAPTQLRPWQRLLTSLRTLATGGTAQATATTVTAIAGSKSGQAVPGGGTARTLVLYDKTGPYAWLGEVYAAQTANLVSHFGSWTTHPVASYAKGELATYTAVVYIGSTFDEPLPVEFLADVTATTKPVLWLYDNIWQLTAQDPGFAAKRGFLWKQFDTSPIAEVRYHGTSLTRNSVNGGGVMDHVIYDPTKAQTVAEAVRSDGTTLPWAVRSGNLTYVGEIPFAYTDHNDRYLAFADLLHDVLAPATPQRHRALVRIEDVGPDADPAELRAVADLLYAKRVPFSVAVYPRYRNPRGVDNGGQAEDFTLWRRPAVVSALKYMRSKGGTLIMHGYTHQYESVANPYDGRSGNDFEFYSAHVDAANSVIYDGPVRLDSANWASNRVTMAQFEFLLAGLPQPTIWEFPHYAGSVTDYKLTQARFGARYDRGLYFPGVLSGGVVDHTKLTGQFFPYAVRDIYGSPVIPENVGNVEPDAFNNHPARLPADLIATARANLVVRDGMASFFYHPFLGTDYLKATVEGIQGLGYTFVPAAATIGG